MCATNAIFRILVGSWSIAIPETGRAPRRNVIDPLNDRSGLTFGRHSILLGDLPMSKYSENFESHRPVMPRIT